MESLEQQLKEDSNCNAISDQMPNNGSISHTRVEGGEQSCSEENMRKDAANVMEHLEQQLSGEGNSNYGDQMPSNGSISHTRVEDGGQSCSDENMRKDVAASVMTPPLGQEQSVDWNTGKCKVRRKRKSKSLQNKSNGRDDTMRQKSLKLDEKPVPREHNMITRSKCLPDHERKQRNSIRVEPKCSVSKTEPTYNESMGEKDNSLQVFMNANQPVTRGGKRSSNMMDNSYEKTANAGEYMAHLAAQVGIISDKTRKPELTRITAATNTVTLATVIATPLDTEIDSDLLVDGLEDDKQDIHLNADVQNAEYISKLAERAKVIKKESFPRKKTGQENKAQERKQINKRKYQSRNKTQPTLPYVVQQHKKCILDLDNHLTDNHQATVYVRQTGQTHTQGAVVQKITSKEAEMKDFLSRNSDCANRVVVSETGLPAKDIYKTALKDLTDVVIEYYRSENYFQVTGFQPGSDTRVTVMSLSNEHSDSEIYTPTNCRLSLDMTHEALRKNIQFVEQLSWFNEVPKSRSDIVESLPIMIESLERALYDLYGPEHTSLEFMDRISQNDPCIKASQLTGRLSQLLRRVQFVNQPAHTKLNIIYRNVVYLLSKLELRLVS